MQVHRIAADCERYCLKSGFWLGIGELYKRHQPQKQGIILEEVQESIDLQPCPYHSGASFRGPGSDSKGTPPCLAARSRGLHQATSHAGGPCLTEPRNGGSPVALLNQRLRAMWVRVRRENSRHRVVPSAVYVP